MSECSRHAYTYIFFNSGCVVIGYVGFKQQQQQQQKKKRYTTAHDPLHDFFAIFPKKKNNKKKNQQNEIMHFGRRADPNGKQLCWRENERKNENH